MNAVVKPDYWNSDEWATPADLVRSLETEFGAFELDPCCREHTAKAPAFFTYRENGLAQRWHGRVWLNPPYSKPAPWLLKAIQETTTSRATLVVAILPVRTDTRWFHDLVLGRCELRFIPGRVYWIGWQGTPIGRPKDPSMLAIYRAPSALSREEPSAK